MSRPSPEYLVRTGSLKNKVIPRDVRREHSSSNYAEYNIQTGCYTWQGRYGRIVPSLYLIFSTQSLLQELLHDPEK